MSRLLSYRIMIERYRAMRTSRDVYHVYNVYNMYLNVFETSVDELQNLLMGTSIMISTVYNKLIDVYYSMYVLCRHSPSTPLIGFISSLLCHYYNTWGRSYHLDNSCLCPTMLREATLLMRNATWSRVPPSPRIHKSATSVVANISKRN